MYESVCVIKINDCYLIQLYVCVQVLQTDLEGVREELDLASCGAEKVFPRTAQPGRPRIQQELSAMEQELESLVQQSNTSVEYLTSAEDQWQQFNDAYEAFMKWLEDCMLLEKDQYKDYAEEKQDQLKKCQVIYDVNI